jgi:phage terminase large subunit-like protein
MPSLPEPRPPGLKWQKPWQAMMDELVLFPQGEHDDLSDRLQTMVEGAMVGPTVRAYRYSPFQRF